MSAFLSKNKPKGQGRGGGQTSESYPAIPFLICRHCCCPLYCCRTAGCASLLSVVTATAVQLHMHQYEQEQNSIGIACRCGCIYELVIYCSYVCIYVYCCSTAVSSPFQIPLHLSCCYRRGTYSSTAGRQTFVSRANALLLLLLLFKDAHTFHHPRTPHTTSTSNERRIVKCALFACALLITG